MKRKLYFLCLIASLSSVALAQADSVQDELKAVPGNRIFISHSQESGTFPLYLETGEATGECGIGLWLDGQLAMVLYPQERSVLYLSSGSHELRASFEPLPEKPQSEEEKKHFKYCKKNKPETLGFVKTIEGKPGEQILAKVRSNQGYLYRIKTVRKDNQEKL